MSKAFKNKRFLIGVILLAFVLRIAGIAFDIKIFSCVPDENYYTNVIYKAFINNSLDINFYWYPSFFFYFNLVLFYLFYFIFKLIFIFFKLWHPLAFTIRQEMFYILKVFIRSFNAILGTILVYIVYRIAKELFDDMFYSYLSIFWAAFNFQLIINSHIAKPDILHTLLTQIVILLSLMFYDNEKKIFFYLAIIFSALAAGTKVLGGISVVVPVYLLFLKKIKNNEVGKFVLDSFIAFFVWIGTFLVSTPFIILKFSKAKEVFNFYKNLSYVKHYSYLYYEKFSRFLNIQRNIYTIPEILFIIFSIIFLTSVLFKKKDIKLSSIYLFSLLYLFIGLFKNFFDARYYLPVVPSVIILMISSFYYLERMVGKKTLVRFIVILITFFPAVRGIKASVGFVLKTTQEESYDFLSKIPDNTFYAFEIMTGSVFKKNNRAVMFLGRRLPKFYNKSRITFVVHNVNNYKMFFKYPEGQKPLKKLYDNYQWVFKHSVPMKIIEKEPIDFLNPKIEFLKLVDYSPVTPDSFLMLKGKVRNKSECHFWIMSGNKILYSIQPKSSVFIEKKFGLNSYKGRSIFFFTPIKKDYCRSKKGYLFIDIEFNYQKGSEIIYFSEKRKVKPNEPLIIYLEEKK